MVDTSMLIFLAVALLIASNHLIGRVLVPRSSPWPFWAFQVFNILVGSTVIAFGIPGFSDYVVVQWVLGGMVLLHVVLNNQARVSYLREVHRERMEREESAAAQRRQSGDELDEE